MGISDQIAEFIRELIDRTEGMAKLSRNDLAEKFGCVPSQINYVLNTRFSPEQGFIVDSRRGGGGYILITRISIDRTSIIMHAVNAIGSAIDAQSVIAFIDNLSSAGVLDADIAKMILASTGTSALMSVPQEYRHQARASILKQCLLCLVQKY